jgi:ribosomal protein S18 acetylase RimI-like enzyme
VTLASGGAFEITLHDDPPRADALVVDAGLDDANAAAAPLHDVQPLGCFARTADGVVGGAIGRTWGRCCELQQLWVEPALRRRGVGAQLVRAFEARAAARGCDIFYLETFSFQAPRLYAALGYEVAHELQGYAPGISKFLMVRRTGPAATRP